MTEKSETTAQSAAKTPVFMRLKHSLGKTRHRLAEGFGNLLLGEKEISEDFLEKLEHALLLADLGIEPTERVMASIIQKTSRQELNSMKALVQTLQTTLTEQLQKNERAITVKAHLNPFVIMFVGVNGAGKTTTIGKLGKHLLAQGLSVLLAAGDTFRAAATEQLQIWGERIQAPVVGQQQGADAAAVIFDAMQAARARNIDVVLVDTAGRLHNKAHLMAELAKIQRVMGAFGNEAPHEVLLVLDASTGRNGLNQVQEFRSTVQVSGLIITKLDGTAKGGFVAEAAQKTGVPICYVGVGETVDDLQPFIASNFVDALLADLVETA